MFFCFRDVCMLQITYWMRKEINLMCLRISRAKRTSSSHVARCEFFYFDVANAAVLIYLAVAIFHALDTHALHLCLARLAWQIRIWLLRKQLPLASLKIWHAINQCVCNPWIKSIMLWACYKLLLGFQVLWRRLQSSVTFSRGQSAKITTVFRVAVTSFQYT